MVILTSSCPRVHTELTLTNTQNSKSLRRLAADHGSLHTAGLPPNYLFPPGADDSADLTSLDILLAGPVGTPYASGVWRLHLDIPPTYPTAPPTAQFRTRLWHPNIDEATGAVCVETLKRDWTSTLKLRDVLVTISCLLIQPNPASALNEAAGKLAVEDWEGYCRRARLMTEIHAAVPKDMQQDVREAQMRGEDKIAEPEQTVAKPHSKGKEKEHVKVTPAGPKLQRPASEDEENRRRRAATGEQDTDPEEDWIPGPGDKTGRGPIKTRRQENNVFGIKGMGGGLDTPPKRVFGGTHTPTPTSPVPNDTEIEHVADDNDPFITVVSKRNAHTLHLTSTETTTTTTATQTAGNMDNNTETPDLLKFSTHNPFSAIQLNNQSHPLLKEFSYTWEDAMVLHDAGVVGTGAKGDGKGMSKAEARKRLVGEEFEKKKNWEMKRLKRAGGDLRRFNRGDFGARTGVGRL
jgi:ubiquitin-conjugating enzyme E2 S